MMEQNGIHVSRLIYPISKENGKLLVVVPCASTSETGEASKETKDQKAPSGAKDKMVEELGK